MVNAKRKGNAGENAFAHFLTSHGFNAHRDSASGGSVWKGDVHNNLDLCIEVKTVKRINLKQCWAQVARDSEKSHATPLLVIHLDGMPEDSWLVVQHSADWAELMHKATGVQVEQTIVPPANARAISYKLATAKSAVQNLLKELDNNE